MFGIPGLLRAGSRRAEVRSVRQVLNGARIFHSPNPAHYGCAFHWNAPEIAQFLIELEENSGERPSHVDEECFYLGVLSLSQGAEPHHYRILDGLQRLTTIAMFLAFARDRLPSKSDRTQIDRLLFHAPWKGPRTPRINLGGAEQDWFNLFILDAGATLDLPAFADGENQRNLLGSARFMHRVFRDYKTSQIRNLVRCLARRTAFVMSEAVSNAVPDRFALPAPETAAPRPEQALAAAGGFDRLPEPALAPTQAPEPAPPVPSEPVIEFPLAASASTPASQRPVPRAPARRSNALWTNARPFAVDTRPPRPANEDRPRHINE